MAPNHWARGLIAEALATVMSWEGRKSPFQGSYLKGKCDHSTKR